MGSCEVSRYIGGDTPLYSFCGLEAAGKNDIVLSPIRFTSHPTISTFKEAYELVY